MGQLSKGTQATLNTTLTDIEGRSFPAGSRVEIRGRRDREGRYLCLYIDLHDTVGVIHERFLDQIIKVDESLEFLTGQSALNAALEEGKGTA